MKKIGIDVRLTYYRHGGIAEYMRQLSSALAALAPAYEIHLLHNFRARETLVPQFKRGNTFTPCHHRIERIALGMELLPRRFDLLHSPDFIPPRLGAKRYVITIHDLAFLLYADIQTADSLRYYAGQIQQAVRQADHIIAVSHTTKNDIIHLLNVAPEKMTVIWEGIHPSFRVSRSHFAPDPYILFVGTIEPRKNIPNLLKGYAILKSRQKAVPKLVLAGQKGWLSEASFAAIESFGLQQEVVWLGSVPFEQLPALYNGATMLVYPSLYEGFGFPPLEAMACGTPVITSDRGALREVSGEAALYVEPEQPESIAEAMQQLLLNETLAQEMRIRGLEHVKQFTWEQTARQTLAVYEKVLP